MPKVEPDAVAVDVGTHKRRNQRTRFSINTINGTPTLALHAVPYTKNGRQTTNIGKLVINFGSLSGRTYIQYGKERQRISDASWATFFDASIAETACTSIKWTPRTLRRPAPLVVRNRKRNSLLQYEPLTVSFVETLWTETTTLHKTYFILLRRGERWVLSEARNTRSTRQACRTQLSYCCFLQAQVFRRVDK